MIQLSQYVMGKPEVLAVTYNQSMILEIKLLDDRTVQLVVDPDGGINLRGWGNKPARLGNVNQVGFHCTIEPECPTTCEV